MVIVHMATMVIAIAPTVIMAIGDTDTMALDPIAETGRGVHIVDGAEVEYTSCRLTRLYFLTSAGKSEPGPGFPGLVTSWGSAASAFRGLRFVGSRVL